MAYVHCLRKYLLKKKLSIFYLISLIDGLGVLFFQDTPLVLEHGVLFFSPTGGAIF